YIPFPYPVSHSRFPSFLGPHPPINTVSDVLSRSNDTHSSLFFIPETEMIAIGRVSAGSSRYRLVTQADLASCVQRSHIYLCEHHQVLRTDLPGSCNGALYLQHEEGVKQNCKIDYKPSREQVYQLSPTDHLVYSPKPLTTQILCQNGSHFSIQIIDIMQITVPELCEINLINHTITSDGNIRLAPPPLQMKMTLDMTIFPSEMVANLIHSDDELNQLKGSLLKLQKLNISDEVFSELLKNHLSSSSPTSIVIWIIVCLCISGTTFGICWYCNILRQRRARRTPFRPNNKLTREEVGTPLRPLRPAPHDDEDEISYIARTGRVR
ncbi:MAG: hypothetical protein ACOYBS_12785, partial [Flavobacterium sp.]